MPYHLQSAYPSQQEGAYRYHWEEAEAKEEPKEAEKEEEPKEKLEVFDSEENKEEQFENIVVQEEPSPVLEMFEQAKKDCEQQLIQAVLNNVKENVIEEINRVKAQRLENL